MPTVNVTPCEKSKYKVLVNYIQQGSEYASLEVANNEADKIIAKYKKDLGL